MLTKRRMDVFAELVKTPFASYTQKELKQLSGEKSNNLMGAAVAKFKEEQLIVEKKVGRASLCSLNLENDLVYYYMAISNHSRLPEAAKRAIILLKEEVEKYTPFYALVGFGSYAAGRQSKTSDVDVAVFIEEEKMRKKMEMAIDVAELKSLLHLHGHVVTKDEFLEMLSVDEENLGKQIARKHMVLHNHQIFYSMLRKATNVFNLQVISEAGRE